MVGSNLQRKVALRGILTIQIYLMPKQLQRYTYFLAYATYCLKWKLMKKQFLYYQLCPAAFVLNYPGLIVVKQG